MGPAAAAAAVPTDTTLARLGFVGHNQFFL